MEDDIRTIVIIPALDEAESLPTVLSDLRTAQPDLDIVVVDDGSTDDTAALARSAGVAVVSLPFNLGIGGALRTGFRYAVDHGYEQAVQFDADGQHDPSAIPVLLEALDDAHLVIGSRFLTGAGDYRVGATRGLAMRLLQIMLRVLTDRRFTDTSSGLRAFDRQMLRHFARHYPTEYLESVEALLDALHSGYRVTEVPVTMHPRAGGEASQANLKLVYHYLRVLMSMSTRVGRRPEPIPKEAVA